MIGPFLSLWKWVTCALLIFGWKGIDALSWTLPLTVLGIKSARSSFAPSCRPD
jgi:hypothetical protein